MNTISALPYDYPLPDSIEHLALVIIDMQRDFLEPEGFGDALGNDVTQLQAIVPALKTLLHICRDLNLLVIHTQECHEPDLSDCPASKLNRGNTDLRIGDRSAMGRILVKGEPGNAIIPELAPHPDEVVIYKPGKGAFYSTPMSSILQKYEITHLLITGVTTEVCVQSTMREANDRGYECLLVEDCTASYFPAFKAATIQMLRAQGGIIGWTSTTEKVCQTLLKTDKGNQWT